ncbi:MAG: hypothetical protein AAFW46_01045 [Pseudomonadota bacterium]
MPLSPELAIALAAAFVLLFTAFAALRMLALFFLDALWPLLWIGAVRPSLRAKRWASGLFLAAVSLALIVGLAVESAATTADRPLESALTPLTLAPLAVALLFGLAVLALRLDPFDPFGGRRHRRGEGAPTLAERTLWRVWAIWLLASALLLRGWIG